MTTTRFDSTVADLCTALGAAPADRPLFARWADALIGGGPPALKSLDELHAYVDVLIAARCCRPTSDLVSQFIAAGLDYDDIRLEVAVLVMTQRPVVR